MKVSLNWLRDYVEIPMEVSELANLLTMAGLEVEQVHQIAAGFEKIVVAEIRSIQKHPNADRLSLVEVVTESNKFSVVCGATNIAEGQKVPLALVGAKLPNGMEIKQSKIRGVISEGMLCSEAELGLGNDASGIMILPGPLKLGENLADALGLADTVLEISVTPNRSDCLSIIGIAREIAALTNQKIRYPTFPDYPKEGEIHKKTSVTILDPDLCPRYVAKMIEGIKVGPSPYWMRSRLENVGVRSINNVVDVTNYVMMEYGQPLHAFDFDLLEEGRIVVRRANEGEEFITLDGVKRKLDSEMLMICDGVKPVAIAGVMGGLNSEIKEDTKNVLLESAYFNPANNRRTAKKLGLETEAAFRFGRGIDYGACLVVANRAAKLIEELAGGRVVEGSVDAYPKQMKPKPINLRIKRIHHVLGLEIPKSFVRRYLENLELKVEEKEDDIFMVTPPSFRQDLEREIDLIEEVARLNGYDKIPVTLPKSPPSARAINRELILERKAINVMVNHGYHEVITYSFISPSFANMIQLPQEDTKRRPLRIINPLSEDLSVMRTTLIPGLLETARYNLSRKNTNLRIFELKKVFIPEEGEKLPKEIKFLSGLAMGFDLDPNWISPPREIDFFDIKGCIEDLLEALMIDGVKFVRAEDVPYLHPKKSSALLINGDILGILGEVHPKVLNNYEIEKKAFLFEINFEKMIKYSRERIVFEPLPKFPAVYRDLSLIVNKDLEAGKIFETILSFREPFIRDVILFDVYEGHPLPEGKRSVSFRIQYQSKDRTLTDEEVNQYHEKVVFRLREMLEVDLR